MVMAAPRSPRLLCFPVPASSFTLARQRQRRRPELHGEATTAQAAAADLFCSLSTAASASSPSQGRCSPAPPRTCGGAGTCYRRLSIPPDTKELGTDDIFPGGIPSPAAGRISWKVQRDRDEGVFAVPQCGWSNEETSLHSKTL
jgi:hypothetical protein